MQSLVWLKIFNDYDVNSMYSYLLCKKHFKFPISEGKYEEITEIDKKEIRNIQTKYIK